MEWVSVKERLPEVGKSVIVHLANWQDIISHRYFDDEIKREAWNYVPDDLVEAWLEYQQYGEPYKWHF